MLCTLYLSGTVGITIYSCACSGSKQVSFLSQKTEHACNKKHLCCTEKQACKNDHEQEPCKNSACTSESIILKVEHQPEQVTLNIAQADAIISPTLLENVDYVNATSFSSVNHLQKQNDSPPKVPLIYQHSRLRL